VSKQQPTPPALSWPARCTIKPTSGDRHGGHATGLHQDPLAHRRPRRTRLIDIGNMIRATDTAASSPSINASDFVNFALPADSLPRCARESKDGDVPGCPGQQPRRPGDRRLTVIDNQVNARPAPSPTRRRSPTTTRSVARPFVNVRSNSTSARRARAPVRRSSKPGRTVRFRGRPKQVVENGRSTVGLMSKTTAIVDAGCSRVKWW